MFEHEIVDGLDVIRVTGSRMDASNAPDFLVQIDELSTSGVSRLAVDLSDVTFMDSSALGATVSALKKIGTSDSFILVGVSGLVEDLFKLTRMDKVFTIVPTLQDIEMVKTA